MSDENTETTEIVDNTTETPEGDISDATLEGSDLKSEQEPETFPREYVEKLRTENGKYRQRAGEADSLAKRLHTELVRATGRLADPTDLPFDAEHLEGSDKLSLAIDELLESKPHLATRRPTGDIGQGNRGPSTSGFSLLDMLKERT
ncbi:hypothetical protein [Mycolicibacterium mageritense]|uniref:hypothetical protein n=1 Tax=Mycolicibacterium mageritense TaxID=53462 RepID=UPI000939D250|nr:hypothetical protein [Mycolicibacterium mageritense]OKH65405.1 hypothetical protein EB73_21945 [Mycobacterium sp. SWH-M3]TXI56237.1 MAG: hypothetical protein E6Q55_29585 [Mycolicibacterium mageritense]